MCRLSFRSPDHPVPIRSWSLRAAARIVAWSGADIWPSVQEGLDEPNAYPLREQNPTKRRPDGKRGARLAAGTLFTKFIGLDTTIARRWIPRIEDSMLVIDLNEEGALVVGNRNRSRTPEKAGDEEG